MSNTTTTPAVSDGAAPTAEPGKTFTQEELNSIIAERLARQQGKLEGDIAQREQELAQKEFLFNAKAALTAKGLPAELMDALNTANDEAFNKSLDIVERVITDKMKQAQPSGFVVTAGQSGGGRTQNTDDFMRGAMGL